LIAAWRAPAVDRAAVSWHGYFTSKLLDQAFEAARALPSDRQDEIARLLLQLTGTEQPAFELTADEEASFAKSFAQADRREFATDEQVRAVWTKHGL